LAKFKGTQISYDTSGNPDRAELTSTGYSLPDSNVYTMRDRAAVIVSVSGHTRPLRLAEKILEIVFARS
jgi:hypothetical protein